MRLKGSSVTRIVFMPTQEVLVGQEEGLTKGSKIIAIPRDP
jgi:hypothetical protein